MKRALLLLLATTAVAHAQAEPATPGGQTTPADDPAPTKPPEPKPDPDPAPAKPADAPAETPGVETAPVPISEPPPTPPAMPIQLRPIEPNANDDLTSAKLSPRKHVDLGWQLLGLPDKLVELLFLPIGLGFSAVDKYALDTRLAEYFDFFEGWLSFSPRFKLSFSDGPGVGGWLSSAKLASSRARLRLGGLVRLNGDWQSELEYRHALLLPGGRGLRAKAYINHDKNRRYYGLGGNTPGANERVLRSNDAGADVDVDLQGIDRYTYSGIAGFGVFRQRLTSGDDSTVPGITTTDTVALPPGYGVTSTYATANISGRYDTRDSNGRPVRGSVAEISAIARKEITGEHLSAITGSATISKLFPVIAEHRTVIFTLSGAAAAPLGSGDTIPLDALPQVSRLNDRGYDSNRFRDKYAVIGSVEYHFPVYEYLASSAGLDAMVFVDTGTLWGSTPFSDLPIHYSVGTGLRAASQNDVVFSMTLAASPDGFQFALGAEGL